MIKRDSDAKGRVMPARDAVTATGAPASQAVQRKAQGIRKPYRIPVAGFNCPGWLVSIDLRPVTPLSPDEAS